MSVFLRLDVGEALDAETLRALAPGAMLALRVLAPAPPLREGQIVHVRRCGVGDRRHGLAVGAGPDGALRPSCPDDHAPVPDDILARVIAIERAGTRLQTERGLGGRVPVHWLPRIADALEALGRLRRPLTPPLFLGAPERCLLGVRDKYNHPAEVRRYATLASGELERQELAIIGRAVRAGGRVLDVGCGAGREALGLARAGYTVVGLDVAPAMVAAARTAAARAGLAIEFRVGSLTELDEPPGTYDGVYIAAALHHVPGRARRIDALRRVRHALTADGALVVFVVYRWPRPLLSRSRLVDVLRRAGARLPIRAPLSEPGDGYMREVSEASDPRRPIFFHDYAGPDEVHAELDAAGLVPTEPASGWWVCHRR